MWPRWGGDAWASVSSVCPGCRGTREPRDGQEAGQVRGVREGLMGTDVEDPQGQAPKGTSTLVTPASWHGRVGLWDTWAGERWPCAHRQCLRRGECVRKRSRRVEATSPESLGWAQGRGLGLPSPPPRPRSHPRCHLRALLDLRRGTCPTLFGDQAPPPCRAPCRLPRTLGELRGGDADGDQPQECRGPGERQAMQPVAGCPGFRALRPSVLPGSSGALGCGAHVHPLLFRVSTHHLHPSSDDEDMEGAFPNELSLQQVRVASSAPTRPFPVLWAALRPLGVLRLGRHHAAWELSPTHAPFREGQTPRATYTEGTPGHGG